MTVNAEEKPVIVECLYTIVSNIERYLPIGACVGSGVAVGRSGLVGSGATVGSIDAIGTVVIFDFIVGSGGLVILGTFVGSGSSVCWSPPL